LFALAISKHYGLTNDETVGQGMELSTSKVDSVQMLSRPVTIILLLVFALSGLTSFAYEIFWTRSLVFILGNTTYAFTLMLAAFLTGIAIGGYAIQFVANRVKSRLRLFAMIEILIGLLSATSLPILFYILESETIQSFISGSSNQIGWMILSESAVAMLLMLLPATLIGATLPLMGQIFVKDLRSTGTTVGKIYALNTLGNVVGALLPGLLILPLMGIQKGILLMSALNICLGLMVLVAHWKKTAVLAAVPIGIFVVFTIGIIKTPISFQFPSELQTSIDSVLFYKEGGLVTTKVWAETTFGKKQISVDGINIGGTGSTDYKQQILAHLPKLLLKSYSSELSIGLGSGILIGESAQHDQLKKIVCVEISPSVVRGAEFFAKENYDVLNNPRTTIVTDDIGHFLQTSSEKFDVISADGKTADRYSSNSFSHSTEYYELLRQHLSPGGLVIQWIPTLPLSQYNLVLRTFLDTFPHVNLWYFPPTGRFFTPNTFLVGSAVKIDIDPDWINQAMAANPVSFHGIGKYGLKTAEDLLSHFAASEVTLRQAVPPGPSNSFDLPYYEFYSPADYSLSFQQNALANYRLIMSARGSNFEKNVLGRLEGSKKAVLWRAFTAEGLFLKGYEAMLKNEPYAMVMELLDRSMALAPLSDVLRNQVVSYVLDQFRLSVDRQDYESALRLARRAVQIYPGSAEVHEVYGMILLHTNQPEAAAFEFQKALELDPELIFSRRSLAMIYMLKGKVDKAMEALIEALSIDPNDVLTLVAIGLQTAQRESVQTGEKHLHRAYELAPKNPAVINGYAHVLYLAGDLDRARDIVNAGGRYYEGNPIFEGVRAKVLGYIR
jgi:spermidine synthase